MFRSATKETANAQLSADAALEVSETQAEGYRGLLLLHDDRQGLIVLFDVEDGGSFPLALCGGEPRDFPPKLVKVPGLDLEADRPAAEMFSTVMRHLMFEDNGGAANED